MKIRRLIVILAVILGGVLLTMGAIWFKQYYDNRYVLEDYYYTIVPLDYDYTPRMSHSDDGQAMGLETSYDLVCYNADGKARKLEFRVFLDSHDLYPPGTYVKVSASKQLAMGKSALAETDVPEKALEKIKENNAPSSAVSLAEYADERTRILKARVYPGANVSCTVNETDLIYSYVYGAGRQDTALSDTELLDPVYKSQFRTDKEAFPELTAIHLIIKLDDGTEVFSRKYNERVEFDYEKE